MKYLLFTVWSLLFSASLMAQQSSLIYHPVQAGFLRAEQERDLLTGQNLGRVRLIIEANTALHYKFPVKPNIFLYGGLGYGVKYYTTRHNGAIADIVTHLGLSDNISEQEAELNIKNVSHTDHYFVLSSGSEFLLSSSERKTKFYLFLGLNLDILLGTKLDPSFFEPDSWFSLGRVNESSIDPEIVSFLENSKYRYIPSIEFGAKFQFKVLCLNYRIKAYQKPFSPAFRGPAIGLLGLVALEFPINSKHKNE